MSRFFAICLAFFTMSLSSVAHAELREGLACELEKYFPIDANTKPHFRRPPAGCEGERFVHVSATVGPAAGIVTVPDPTCGNQLDTPSVASSTVGAIAATYSGNPAFGIMVTNVGDQLLNGKVRDELRKAPLPRPISDLFFQKTTRGTCASLVAGLPADAEVTGARLIVADLEGGPGECEPGIDCWSGWAKFLYRPVTRKVDGMVYVHTDFMNWSHTMSKTGGLIVFYKLPPGTPQPVPMR